MLNLPIPLEHPMTREIGLGFIYGAAMAATLAQPRRFAPQTWCLVVIACGYTTVSLWQTWGDRSTFCHTWVLAGLVCLCRAYDDVRRRIEDFSGDSRQFALFDLLMLATGFALFAAGLRQTSLADREPVYWAGMIIIGGVFPWCVVGLRTENGLASILTCSISVLAAAGLVIGLSWAESSIVQPGRIDMSEAVWRYGGMITAMMLPRLMHQLTRIPFSCPHRHVPNAAR
ncbi:membrane protein [Rhodopirellula sp. SWK7]|nr:membrane protein [Rhodopirellula sp. SWK7]